jgi:hypothetical protein
MALSHLEICALLPLSPPVSTVDIRMVTDEDIDNMPTTDEESTGFVR